MVQLSMVKIPEFQGFFTSGFFVFCTQPVLPTVVISSAHPNDHHQRCLVLVCYPFYPWVVKLTLGNLCDSYFHKFSIILTQKTSSVLAWFLFCTFYGNLICGRVFKILSDYQIFLISITSHALGN